MSTEKQSSSKRRLVKESPFQRLAQRTIDIGEEALKEARLIDLDRIQPNPRQPRRRFDADRLQELADDVKARGILQPPIVRPYGDGYEIVVGERRYQAAKMAGLEQIPVIVRDLADEDAQIISLVENIQREDLDFEDEARYFQLLQQEYDYSLRDIAAIVNKSKSYVDARLRLLKRPDILAAVQNEKLGLHEATLLTRMQLETASDGELVEKSVREKDSSKSVREKDNSLQSPLVQPFRRLTDLIKNTHRKIARASLEEREAILQSIDELEQELKVLRQRIKN